MRNKTSWRAANTQRERNDNPRTFVRRAAKKVQLIINNQRSSLLLWLPLAYSTVLFTH